MIPVTQRTPTKETTDGHPESKDMKRVSIESLPHDFVVLLQFMLDEFIDHELTDNEVITTYTLAIEPHFQEWEELCQPNDIGDGWKPEDFKLAELYGKRISDGVTLPPLIVSEEHGLLRDGYHRLYALRMLGVTHYPMIVLSRLIDEIGLSLPMSN